MSCSNREDIVFSEHASLSLFECLVVAGAPPTGILQDIEFEDELQLQESLFILREMWQRADLVFVPRGDLECLHRMESISTLGDQVPIYPSISMDKRKRKRYYIYLLFRYCMSFARPRSRNCHGWMSSCSLGFSRLPVKRHKTLINHLQDVPGTWLESTASTNLPSTPPCKPETTEGYSPAHLQYQDPQENLTGSTQYHLLQNPITKQLSQYVYSQEQPSYRSSYPQVEHYKQSHQEPSVENRIKYESYV